MYSRYFCEGLRYLRESDNVGVVSIFGCARVHDIFVEMLPESVNTQSEPIALLGQEVGLGIFMERP